MLTTSDRQAAVVDALSTQHPHYPRVRIEHWVAEVFDSYRSAPVQTYVPVLVQREVAARLNALDAARSPRVSANRR